ncbi:MAG: cation:proton antiporter [Acidobacteriota bacterium]
MTLTPDLIMALAALAIVALAADKVGAFFGRLRLPLITGFLFTGVLAGPHGLDLIRSSAIGHLHVVSETTIAFIAFAAGSELDLGDLKHRLRSIRWVSTGLVVVTFSSTVVATLLVADALPFARALPATERWAVALLAGAVLVARSPSSAIAVVNELRARGPFTGMVLGVTVVMDAVVIVLFAASSSMADALLAGQAFDLQVPLLVLGEIVVSLGLGFLLGKVLPSLVGGSRHQTVRAGLLLATGLLNFSGADLVRTLSRARLSVDILIEPLLVCMVAAFVSTNFTSHTGRVREVVESAGPTV